MDPAQLVSLIASLNPDNTPGRLAVIVRMGAEKLRQKFPALIEAVEQAGQVRSLIIAAGAGDSWLQGWRIWRTWSAYVWQVGDSGMLPGSVACPSLKQQQRTWAFL
jgi:hypothetical protein